MATSNEPVQTSSDRELVLTRVFDAPRELVWKVWTEAKHLSQWWGPRGFTTKVTELDFRPGGRWRFVMIGPDGKEYPCHGVFHEIVPLERFVASDEFEEGPEYPVPFEQLPKEMITTYLFEDLGRKTKVTLRILHQTAEDCAKHEKMGVVAGWNSSLDCLEEYLAKLA